MLHADAHRHREAVGWLARAMAAMPDASPRLKAAFGKWPGLFARLALTFHLIDAADARARGTGGPSLAVVAEDTARRAAAFLRDVVLPHLLRADALMFSTAQTGHARWIAGFILARAQPRVALRDVVQAYGPLRAPEAQARVAGGDGEPGHGRLAAARAASNPARPPAAWAVNPAVHTMLAARGEQERQARTRVRREIAAAVRRQRGRGIAAAVRRQKGGR